MTEGSRTARGVPLALFLSGLAIGLSMVEALFYVSDLGISNEVKRASVMPYIEVTYAQSDTEIRISAGNRGAGLAMIKNVVWTVNGKGHRTWETSLDDIFADVEGFSEKCTWGRGQLSNRAIQNGRTADDFVFRISCNPQWCAEVGGEGDKCRVLWSRFLEHWKGINSDSHFSTCFCSIFGDCWEGLRREFYTDVKQISYTRAWYEVYLDPVDVARSPRFAPNCEIRKGTAFEN